jgi:hypothetical protein
MMITIEDKYRIQSHGFDKYSFRKGKSKAWQLSNQSVI